MNQRRRVFLIILDSFGAGALDDAAFYGDEGSNTVLSVASSPYFNCPNLTKAGLFRIKGLTERDAVGDCFAAHGRAAELSAGKDTTVGHWEICGIVTEKPFPVYPHGFPDDVMSRFNDIAGLPALCNLPYSGTQVINDYGAEHIATGRPIVYTSADSVFQIACHEDIWPIEKLYAVCEKTREMLSGEHGVSRVIARPFIGAPGAFVRTENRRDYSLEPPMGTVPDILSGAGLDVIAVGKISNIFAGRGMTESVHTSGNTEGINYIKQYLSRDFNGLCFVNLVDFDMKYGHRNDIDGYARAMSEFDAALGVIYNNMRDGDLFIVTADHGCDPATPSTDHSREYIPILCFGNGVKPVDFGTRKTFADIGATVCEYLAAPLPKNGTPFLGEIT